MKNAAILCIVIFLLLSLSSCGEYQSHSSYASGSDGTSAPEREPANDSTSVQENRPEDNRSSIAKTEAESQNTSVPHIPSETSLLPTASPEKTEESEYDNMHTRTFNNPIADHDSPDPFMTYDRDTGYYYASYSGWDRIILYRSKHAADILNGEEMLVLAANKTDNVKDSVWAPEMHKAPNGKWYIYSSCRKFVGSENDTKHLFVLESVSNDPFDGFQFKGFLDDSLFAIDPTVYTKGSKQYMCYSLVVDGHQYLEVRDMINPYTLGEKRCIVGKAQYAWELVPPYDESWSINEGAFFVENAGRTFLIYSGNGCWSDEYCLGVIEFTGGDFFSKENWVKSSTPLMTKGEDLFAPGHATFFWSPDNRELWCCFHATTERNVKNEEIPRYMCLQKVNFDQTGYPVMGKTLSKNTDQKTPSGEGE